MIFTVSVEQIRRAKTPHEVAMINLLLLNLPLAIAILAGSMAAPETLIARWKWLLIALPLVASLSLLIYIWRRAAASRSSADWFVAMHWRLSARRAPLLLGGYLLTAALLGFSALGDGAAVSEQRLNELPPAMQEMERRKYASQNLGAAVWARIAVVPLLLVVMVSIMLESGGIYQAGRGELPDGLLGLSPPPDGVPRGIDADAE